MEYLTVQKATEKWNSAEHWVQKRCKENKIKSVIQFSRAWMISKGAVNPIEGRKKDGEPR